MWPSQVFCGCVQDSHPWCSKQAGVLPPLMKDHSLFLMGAAVSLQSSVMTRGRAIMLPAQAHAVVAPALLPPETCHVCRHLGCCACTYAAARLRRVALACVAAGPRGSQVDVAGLTGHLRSFVAVCRTVLSRGRAYRFAASPHEGSLTHFDGSSSVAAELCDDWREH